MQSIDWNLFQLVNGLAGHGSLLDGFLRLCANGLEYVLLVLVATLWLTPGEDERVTRHRRHIVLYALSSALIALGINQLIGHAWFRPRPFAAHHVTLLLDRSTDSSFPSDHAAGAFALAAAVVLARDRWARWLGALLLVLATLLAVCRVAAGTHYPFDVIAGGLIGSSVAFAIWQLDPLADPLLGRLLSPIHRLTSLVITHMGLRRWHVPAD